jgi:hypothetical protein
MSQHHANQRIDYRLDLSLEQQAQVTPAVDEDIAIERRLSFDAP